MRFRCRALAALQPTHCRLLMAIVAPTLVFIARAILSASHLNLVMTSAPGCSLMVGVANRMMRASVFPAPVGEGRTCLLCDQGVTGWSQELLRSYHQRSKTLVDREKHWRTRHDSNV